MDLDNDRHIVASRIAAKGAERIDEVVASRPGDHSKSFSNPILLSAPLRGLCGLCVSLSLRHKARRPSL
jgi:hypothetical protein